jgi:hypothetical protein
MITKKQDNEQNSDTNMKSDEPEHMNGEENQSNQTHMKT